MVTVAFEMLIVSAAALGVRLLLEHVGVGSGEDIRTAAFDTVMVLVGSAAVYAVELLVVLTLTHGVCFPHAVLNGVASLSGAMSDIDTDQSSKKIMQRTKDSIFSCTDGSLPDITSGSRARL